MRVGAVPSVGLGCSTRDDGHVTLHEAMIEVLRENGAPMTSREIADSINARELYRRKDGHALLAGQVSARARNYHQLFHRTASHIAVR